MTRPEAKAKHFNALVEKAKKTAKQAKRASTHERYSRQIAEYKEFCRSYEYDETKVDAETPNHIVAFITESCEHCGYKKAEQQRSALKHYFKSVLKCSDGWDPDGSKGNPCDSHDVKEFMKGLEREKDIGRVVKRSLPLLYPHMAMLDNIAKRQSSVRSMFYDTLWKVCFYFMFRIDEALNLRLRDVKYGFLTRLNTSYAVVNVPWRKTTDSGTQYELHPAPSEEVAVDAYATLKKWLEFLKSKLPCSTDTQFIFSYINSSGEIVPNKKLPQSTVLSD